jgi:putative transcriptional regulator
MNNQLKELRERDGWTQGGLADQLGVSRQTVNALETGRYDPSLPLAFRIAALFALPIEAIFHPADTPLASPRPSAKPDLPRSIDPPTRHKA